MLYFSPSTCGFYDSRINADLPADRVAVTEAERDAALAALIPGHRIAAGPDGKPIVARAEIAPDVALSIIRARRDKLLRASDHSQMPDYPIDPDARAAWAAYRQALRDLPETLAAIGGDPDQVEWPVPPDAPATPEA